MECEQNQIQCAPLTFVAKDILEEDWSDADIIFTNSLLFSDEVMESIADLNIKLKKGTRIISSQKFPERDYLKLTHAVRMRMGWGLNLVYVYYVI